MKAKDLGKYLRVAREQRGLSQLAVAKILHLNSGQSVSDWERNKGSTIPIPAYKKLIQHYRLNSEEAFQVFLSYRQSRLEEKIRSEFFGKKRTRAH